MPDDGCLLLPRKDSSRVIDTTADVRSSVEEVLQQQDDSSQSSGTPQRIGLDSNKHVLLPLSFSPFMPARWANMPFRYFICGQLTAQYLKQRDVLAGWGTAAAHNDAVPELHLLLLHRCDLRRCNRRLLHITTRCHTSLAYLASGLHAEATLKCPSSSPLLTVRSVDASRTS